MANTNRGRWAGIVTMAVLAAAVALWRQAPAPVHAPAPEAQAPRDAVSAPAAAERGFGAAVGFRSRERLREHFDKHGAEFRGADQAAYLAIAQHLRDAPVSDDVLQSVRADGVVSRFERSSGTFVAFDADGIIRTCFKPNDGERYFVRQAKRRSP